VSQAASVITRPSADSRSELFFDSRVRALLLRIVQRGQARELLMRGSFWSESNIGSSRSSAGASEFQIRV